MSDSMTIAEFDELRSQLLAEGYTSFHDPNDAEAAEDYPCNKCGNEGVMYSGYRKDLNSPDFYGLNYSYRAFAKCPTCEEVWEF